MTTHRRPMFPNLHASAAPGRLLRIRYSNAVMSERTNSILELFERTGGYLRGHFLLTSGLHSPEYLQCAVVLQYPEQAARLGANLAEALALAVGPRRVSLVASPALGGIVIGHEVARALGARAVFTERDAAGAMTLRRGFRVEPGEAAVVIEDVVTTGGSTREVIQVLRAAGAEVLAAGSIIDRSAGKADVSVPRVALATLDVVTYRPEECPLCRAGIPLLKPGSRR